MCILTSATYVKRLVTAMIWSLFGCNRCHKFLFLFPDLSSNIYSFLAAPSPTLFCPNHLVHRTTRLFQHLLLCPFSTLLPTQPSLRHSHPYSSCTRRRRPYPAIIQRALFARTTILTCQHAMHDAFFKMSLSPAMKEAIMWFGIGSALAAFVCTAMLLFAISAPGLGSTTAVVRAVGKRVDAVLCPERECKLRQSRRSFDSLL